MIRVLHVMAGADAGGISSVILNYYTYIDRSKVHFDIALTTNNYGLNGKRLTELGANFYYLPLKSKDMQGYKKGIVRLLLSEKYDAIHVHENLTSFYALRIAKKKRIKIRIAHAHTSAPSSNPDVSIKIKRMIGIILNNYYATNLIACGQKAGEWVFGKKNMKTSKAILISNAIDPEQFRYKPEKRRIIREENQDDDKFIIGMVGRLSPEKNHSFAFDVLDEVRKTIPNVVLYVVGNGELNDSLVETVKNRGLDKNIKFLGRRSDVNDLFSAFDVLIMPSQYEGFPVVAAEALGTGISILLSNRITTELEKYQTVKYLSIESIDPWVKELVHLFKNGGNDRPEILLDGSDLDIKYTSKLLQNLYLTGDK